MIYLFSDLLFPGQQATTVFMCLDCWDYAITCKIPQFVLTTILCRLSGQADCAWLEATRSREGQWQE